MHRFTQLLPLAVLLSPGTTPLLAAADGNVTPSCANACYNYLSQLANQASSSGNGAIQTLAGTVKPAEVVATCAAAKPLDCCACGAPTTPAITVLDAWTLTCATLAAVPDGGITAAACWNSNLKSSCSDYGGLLEGANCTAPVVAAANSSALAGPSVTSAAGNLSTTTAAGGPTHSPNAASAMAVSFLGWSSLGIAVWMLGVA
jgi:hypothetical protein